MVTVETFKRFMEGVGGELADRVLLAKAAYLVERERVDAYVEPIFATFGFRDKRTGELLTKSRDLYLAPDDDRDGDDRQAAYYEAVDQAHRDRGFTGPKGHCPALIAECEMFAAEKALLKAAGEVFGFDADLLYGKNREKMLDLLLGANAIKYRR